MMTNRQKVDCCDAKAPILDLTARDDRGKSSETTPAPSHRDNGGIDSNRLERQCPLSCHDARFDSITSLQSRNGEWQFETDVFCDYPAIE